MQLGAAAPCNTHGLCCSTILQFCCVHHNVSEATRQRCMFLLPQQGHPPLADHVARGHTSGKDTCFRVGLGQISLSSSPLLPAFHRCKGTKCIVCVSQSQARPDHCVHLQYSSTALFHVAETAARYTGNKLGQAPLPQAKPCRFWCCGNHGQFIFRKLTNNPTLLQGRICPLSHATAHSVLLERKTPAKNAKNMLQEEFTTQKLESYYVQIIQETSLE